LRVGSGRAVWGRAESPTPANSGALSRPADFLYNDDMTNRRGVGRLVGRSLPAVLAVLLCGGGWSQAQELAAASQTQPVPDAIAAPIRDVLSPEGVRVTSGAVTLDFWWVRSLTVRAGDLSWLRVDEGSLVGAVRLSDSYRDIRGKTINAGVYTLRYAVQPDDGDHLGVSPYRDFLLLSPAGEDGTPAPTGHFGTVSMSKDTIGASHPAPWSLDPPVTEEPLFSTGKTEMGLTYLVLEVPTSAGRALRFGLVLIGRIDA
jgi:hypothetical protein